MSNWKPNAPIRDRPWALFLDVDGTLIEITRRPDAVHVSGRLRLALSAAYKRESGALALVSGRSIEDLDRLFAPHTFPVAALHGLERRGANERLVRQSIDHGALDGARERLLRLAAAHPGVLIEDKGSALALHYRQVLHLEHEITAALQSMAADVPPRFHVQAGKCVLEIKPAGCSKGTAIEAFMGEPPFAGRMPVFVGDDQTDEEGFAVVNAHGGLSVHVGYSGPTAAHWRFADVNEVIRWLGAPHRLHGKRIMATEQVA